MCFILPHPYLEGARVRARGGGRAQWDHRHLLCLRCCAEHMVCSFDVRSMCREPGQKHSCGCRACILASSHVSLQPPSHVSVRLLRISVRVREEPALIEFAASDNQVPDDQEQAQSAGCIEHIFRCTFPLRCLLQLLIAAPNVLCCKEGIGHELVDVCRLRCQVAYKLCLQLRYLYQRLLGRSAKLISITPTAGADRHT